MTLSSPVHHQHNPCDPILERPQVFYRCHFNSIQQTLLISLAQALSTEGESELNVTLCDEVWLTVLNRVHLQFV